MSNIEKSSLGERHKNYSEREFARLMKRYSYQERFGNIYAIIWIIFSILPPVLQWSFEEMVALSSLLSGEFLAFAFIAFHLSKIVVFYRSNVHSESDDELEQLAQRLTALKKRGYLIGRFGMGIWGVILWNFWGDITPPLSDIWLWPALAIWIMPILFWTPGILYREKIQVMRFFQEYKRRKKLSMT